MILIACAMSFLSAGLLAYWVLAGRDRTARRRLEKELIHRHAAAMAVDPIDDATLLRDESLSGFGPLDAFLNSLRMAGNLRRLIAQADLRIKVATLLMMMVLLGVVGFLAGYAAHLGMGIAAILGGLLGSTPYTYVLIRRKRRIARFETQFPEAVDLMSRAIRAGHAFSTGIKMVADEMPDPVGKEFRRVFEEQNLGLPLRNALMGLQERVDLVDIKLFVVAVLIQRQSGGNLSEILDKIAYTIRERFRIYRQLKVHTAQAKLTGIILTALPPIVGTAIFALNYDYMKIIFEQSLGLRILAGAAVLQVLGFLWIRKIVNIEV
ncbi:MAG TPA: type II secretion system F family protein [Candidatus Polarisedimenticolia bacterium]|nr:type II secretion system F family protein [Candidatus Polarisedimenticolia bacterium]